MVAHSHMLLPTTAAHASDERHEVEVGVSGKVTADSLDFQSRAHGEGTGRQTAVHSDIRLLHGVHGAGPDHGLHADVGGNRAGPVASLGDDRA